MQPYNMFEGINNSARYRVGTHYKIIEFINFFSIHLFTCQALGKNSHFDLLSRHIYSKVCKGKCELICPNDQIHKCQISDHLQDNTDDIN